MKAPLRASDWWSYKVPPLLAVGYFAVAIARQPLALADIARYLAFYIMAVIGIAGFGHVLLDAFDIEEDRLLGKPNLWAPLDTAQRVGLLGALLLASWLPWLVLPIGPIGLAIIGLQFLLFFAYAMPPIRLKDRGFAGVTADAMYAHALPTLWTWILFSNISGAEVPRWFPFVLGGWALTVGMRHLLQHQALEAESDRRAEVRTYAVRHGSGAAQSLIVRVVVPLEVLSFLALLAVIGARIPVAAAGFVLFLAWHVVKARRAASGAERSFVVRTFILSRFYEKWLPLLILAGMSLKDPVWLVLLLVHAFLFRGAPRGERGAARYAAAHRQS